MRKTALTITHEEVTVDALSDLVSGRGKIRKGLRIAIVQGVMDKASITELSRRHRISREGIYLIIERVNLLGLRGLDEGKRPGRPSQLTPELRDELIGVLSRPPQENGYNQSRWDGPLLIRYLEERHDIHLGHSQVNTWFHALGITLQRGRHTYAQADPAQQEQFVAEVKKTPREKRGSSGF